MEIGEAIRRARQAQGWTVTDVAAAAGVTEAAARRWEKGQAVIPRDKLEKLRRAIVGLPELLDHRAVA